MAKQSMWWMVVVALAGPAACATSADPGNSQREGALAPPAKPKCKGNNALECNDGNACTQDTCDKKSGGCVYTPVAGTCSDGDDCTTGDSCSGGACVGSPVDCNDGDPCTTDSCSAGSCLHVPVNCDDGNACTSDACDAGGCKYIAVVCDDDNVCTDDSCNPAVGCVFTPNMAPCNDGNACTINDKCSAGSCVSEPINCDDGDACTFDTCDGGCIHSTHDVCSTGVPLGATCNDCTALICSFDEFCCEEAWDSICVAEVVDSCGIPCPSAPTSVGSPKRRPK
jgi:hypothetical protein